MDNLSAFLSRSLSHHAGEETRDDHLEERIEAAFEKSTAFLQKVERRFENDESLRSLFLEILSLFVDGEISDERSLHRIITGDIFRARHRQLAREYVREFVRDVPKFKPLANVLDAIDEKDGKETPGDLE